MEISIHRNSKKVFDYKKSNSKKLFGVAGLLAIPTLEEIEKMTADYNSTLASFEKNIEGCNNSINEANKLIDKFYEAVNKGDVKIKEINVDISGTGKYKDFLLNDSKDVPRISDLKGVNEEYLQPVLDSIGNSPEEHISAIERLARVAEKFENAYDGVVWIIQNPLNALLKVLEGVAPIIVTGSVIIIIIGLIAKLLGSEKLFNMNTKDMVINPIVFLIIYLILITALRCVVG